ncbi:hypothetical protein GGR52DRAFT_241616 [Hypoxylon sp. FL1284]|nr:hypothetical protein GGR52DRAFT_241616 [Hypoxylon sp. FL1284]
MPLTTYIPDYCPFYISPCVRAAYYTRKPEDTYLDISFRGRLLTHLLIKVRTCVGHKGQASRAPVASCVCWLHRLVDAHSRSRRGGKRRVREKKQKRKKKRGDRQPPFRAVCRPPKIQPAYRLPTGHSQLLISCRCLLAWREVSRGLSANAERPVPPSPPRLTRRRRNITICLLPACHRTVVLGRLTENRGAAPLLLLVEIARPREQSRTRYSELYMQIEPAGYFRRTVLLWSLVHAQSRKARHDTAMEVGIAMTPS